MNSEINNIIMQKLMSIDVKLDTLLALQAAANETIIDDSIKIGSHGDYPNHNKSEK